MGSAIDSAVTGLDTRALTTRLNGTTFTERTHGCDVSLGRGGVKKDNREISLMLRKMVCRR